MNRKISMLAAAMLFAVTFTSCGGKKAEEGEKKDSTATTEPEKPAPSFADMCKDENAMTVTIKGYSYGMKDKKYAFETPNFEVKQSSFTMTTDSTATIKLSNYAPADLVGDRKDEQVDIMVDLRARKGKKILDGGVYENGGSGDLYAATTFATSKGTVWFNWLAGMPEVGTVKINFVDESHICGTFTLASEKPDNDMIGTVRLNGNFKVGE
jgi:hypothetical protein